MEKLNSFEMLSETTDFLSRTYGVTNNMLVLNQLISQNQEAYSNLVEKFAEGMHESEAKDFTQLAENSSAVRLNESLFSESSASIMSKFAILDTMLLREIWNRLGARDAMTYKVLDVPFIQIPFMKQYMRGPNGEIMDVPQALNAFSLTGKEFNGLIRFLDKEDSATPTKVVNYCEFNVFTNFKEGGLAIQNSSDSTLKVDTSVPNPNGNLTIDTFGEIYDITVSENGSTSVTDNSKDQKLDLVFKADTEGNFYCVVNFFDNATKKATAYSDTIMGKVDRTSGNVTFSVMKGFIRSFKFKTAISQETNRHSYEMVPKMEKVIVTVGDGDTINSSVPVQYIQDLKNIMKLDAISELTKLLSQAFALVYDNEVYNTVAKSVVAPTQKTSFNASMVMNNAHIGISRQMHNANLLDKLIKSVGIIDNTYNFNSDVDYYVLCNPIENAIISSAIAPEYAGSVSAGGVVKPYTSGQLVGSLGRSDIRVVSSKSYKQGEMYVVPKPSNDSEIVFGYYDYSQVLMPLGTYRNERNDLVPNIMMNKRKAIHAFRPESTHCVTVTNSTKDV